MFPSKNTEKNLLIILYLNAIYPLGPSLKNYLVQHIKSCSFLKNQFICEAGEICDRLYFIKKGMVRGYFVSDGIELTTWVDTENEVFTSITGFFRNEISPLFDPQITPAVQNITTPKLAHSDVFFANIYFFVHTLF